MKASIDIGSNSILLLVGEYVDQSFHIVENEARITGLGRGIDKTKMFCEDAMDLSFSALSEYVVLARKHGIDASDIVVTATEASRVVTNSAVFFEMVRDKLELSVSIICGKGEAFYTALGVSSGMKELPAHTVVMDIGGASTEFVSLKAGELESSVSLPIGCVRATEWNEHNEFDTNIKMAIKRFGLEDYKTKKLVCVAGSMTSLAAVYLDLADYKDEDVHGLTVSIEDYEGFCERLNKLSANDLLRSYPYLGKRVHVLHAGAEIAHVMAKELGVQTIEVSTFGLRFGTLREGKIDTRFLSN